MDTRLPPNQRWAAPGRWPVVGERSPRAGDHSVWRLSVAGLVQNPTSFGLDDLRRLACIERPFDIHCVTRWSKASVRFRGIPLATLFDSTGLVPEARFVWMQARSDRSHGSSIPLTLCGPEGAMLAWEADGEPLPSEHGGPLRVVVPGRYFYKSVKWIERLELLAEDRLGWWEAESGYHNGADPWREERYVVRGLDRARVAALVSHRDVTGLDLLGLDASGHDLTRFKAAQSLLRDSRFVGATLIEADFTGANLSNAHFRQARLDRAIFLGADCEGADFSGADLTGADFRGASLFGATFDGARLDGCRFDEGVDPHETA
jgi:DMSO/TMAO reductase YedYZ molybdopterin-dependent catalytic subunit